MRHTISVLVENKFGVLARIAGLFSGRGFNIESLSVAETLDPSMSHMTITTIGNDSVVEQITKHLNKLIEVIKVVDLTAEIIVEREMALIKVSAETAHRAEILRIADIFRSNVVDVSPKTYTLEVTGDEEKINAILNLLKPFGIKEIVRTGRIAMTRGIRTGKSAYDNGGG
ncbi:MAG: acetolactate synthase small subunit [Candidatus Tectomicrobia bacterium]|uniref:Acetolactate synthase small subunit n=1 Tax=Tectimicrobiota bacterium TaxID=2528274 RepID=A0A933LPN2_UNCTE|nr:acetolactate synthase small subunit [Candidatus Tectomicrobia bacterium]